MNLWILTEERPKIDVLDFIIKRFLQDKKLCAFINNLRILPIVKNNKFTFNYEIIGIENKQFDKIYLKIISGNSSFVDYLVFFQENEPNIEDSPIYAIEETKTDDKESRNTGVYQRITKFVYLDFFYPSTIKIMFYNLKIEQKETPTQTSIFGTKILRTLGVEIVGKQFVDSDILEPFKDVDDLIDFKNAMRKPPKNNTPINIIKIYDSDTSICHNKMPFYDISKIQISGRLFKNNSLSHDPNIGAISGIAAVLRKLRFNGDIEIISHGLNQNHLGKNNKFIHIANKLNISLQGLTLPQTKLPKAYWHYEIKGEKLVSIFIHMVIESFSYAKAIFENHAGCEKSYFLTSSGEHIPLQKYENREAYKAGDKNARLFIPDLILLDVQNLEIINIEGKKFQNKAQGIEELKNYNFIEQEYIKKYYPAYKIIRTLVLYGGNKANILETEIGLLLDENGNIILGIKAPKIFILSITNLINFWKK
ncbi:hypothetical protein LS71_003195 [Helicobacter jaachi]|uniref:Uncharacterized protein n=1 Tax=Helicobacter jaachi TaxID=1677920 RepID=A0A4V6I2X5_9HELI|nr:hypothetical protein [Helicobacter jaachi]TLD97752.1 hypothetical protein LS71_003195 [Helicobacter jaachi]